MVIGAVLWYPPQHTGGEITTYIVRMYNHHNLTKEITYEDQTEREWIRLDGTVSTGTYVQVYIVTGTQIIRNNLQ